MGLEYTGAAWPNPIPFSGYRYLGILPGGRAIRDEDQLPIRTGASTDGWPGIEATAVVDPRVKFIPGVLPGSSEATLPPREVPVGGDRGGLRLLLRIAQGDLCIDPDEMTILDGRQEVLYHRRGLLRSGRFEPSGVDLRLCETRQE